jgi:4-hydroxythreonine-4-phosphate dehydrogenase
MMAAIFEGIEIFRQRMGYAEMHSNPLKKISARMIANSVDERFEENER